MFQNFVRYAAPLAAAAALVACSSDNNTTPDGSVDSGTSPAGGDSGVGTGGSTTGGTTGGATASAEFTTGPCTEAGTICTTYSVPADMAGAPARLFVAFYNKLPPAGPPDVFGNELKTDLKIEAGKSFTLKQRGITGVDGESLFVYTVIYMPGGGQFQPKVGVDYVAETAAKITFDVKAPTNVDSVTFAAAK